MQSVLLVDTVITEKSVSNVLPVFVVAQHRVVVAMFPHKLFTACLALKLVYMGSFNPYHNFVVGFDTSCAILSPSLRLVVSTTSVLPPSSQTWPYRVEGVNLIWTYSTTNHGAFRNESSASGRL